MDNFEVVGMSELKVGDVVSYQIFEGRWIAGVVSNIVQGFSPEMYFGASKYYFLKREQENIKWVKGLHESLIPEGFAIVPIVPIEPTQNMVKDAMKWFSAWSYMRPADKKNAVEDAYKAMIESAPKPMDKKNAY